MLPVVAILGRPNVGKSTLFNRLTGTRNAIVADFPGLTRDRQFGRVYRDGRGYLLIDTGGLVDTPDELDRQVVDQALKAVEDADLVLFMVDASGGLTAQDEFIGQRLRQTGTSVVVVPNKAEGVPTAGNEFFELGFADVFTISARHGDGVKPLRAHVVANLPPPQPATATTDPGAVRVAIVGRPNVGKSTLLNRLAGEARQVVSDVPGTTRDAISVPVRRDGRHYAFIDTAGVRRRSKVSQAIEKFSIVKSLAAIDQCEVVVYLLDATEGPTEQDLNLLGDVLRRGRGCVVAVNKWDGLSSAHRQRVRDDVERRLRFIEYAPLLPMSALHGTGVGDLYGLIDEIWESASREIRTGDLNAALEAAQMQHPPPLARGRRIKLRYAHTGGHNPLTVVIHGNQTARIPGSYRRYLENFFRRYFDLVGVPIRIEFKQATNPFAGRRNTLTPRQQRKRDRLIKHRRS